MDKKLNNHTLILYGGGDNIAGIDQMAFGSLKRGAIIFFSPSAKDSLEKQEEYFNFFRKHVDKFGSFDIRKLDLTREHFDQSAGFIKNADMVYFGGGNSFLLNKLIEDSKFVFFLKKRERSIILAGYSAGAVIMGKNIFPVKYMDKEIIDAPDEGIGLIPWSIFPHYVADDKQTNFLLECVKNNNIIIVAIPNDCGLVCSGDKCRVVGKTYVDIFLPSEKIERFTSGSIISKSYGI